MFVKQAPKLKCLTIYSNIKAIIDGCQWERLITSSLRSLNTFKFKFDCLCETENNAIFESSKQFENDLSYVKKRSYNVCLFEIWYYQKEIFVLPYTLMDVWVEYCGTNFFVSRIPSLTFLNNPEFCLSPPMIFQNVPIPNVPSRFFSEFGTVPQDSWTEIYLRNLSSKISH